MTEIELYKNKEIEFLNEINQLNINIDDNQKEIYVLKQELLKTEVQNSKNNYNSMNNSNIEVFNKKYDELSNEVNSLTI